jgi:hypothetical protein
MEASNSSHAKQTYRVNPCTYLIYATSSDYPGQNARWKLPLLDHTIC